MTPLKTFQANVACKQLKFTGAFGYACCSPRGALASTAFSYDDVKCTGSETTLDACPHANTHDCSASEGVWLTCNAGNGK